MRHRYPAAALAGALLSSACSSGPAAAPPPAPPEDRRVPAIPEPRDRQAPRLAELRALSEQVVEAVARARDLPVRGRFRVSTATREQVRAYVRKNLYEHVDRDTFLRMARVEASFGVLPAGADPEAILLELLENGIQGYYDAATDTFFVVEQVPLPMVAMVVGHELAHALQDMHFDLERFERPHLHDSDGDAARTFLIEGDAQAAYLASRTGEGGLSELRVNVLDAAIDQALRFGAASPYPVLARSLQLPYAAGTATVLALARSRGWGAVDRLYDAPPRTSEQMLHLEKLLARERPRPLRIDPIPLERALGWRVTWHDNLGEAALLSMLADVTDPGAARRAAAGWGGDTYVALEPEEGTPTPAVVGAIAFDTDVDAEEFAGLFERYLRTRAGPSGVLVDRQGPTVLYALRLPDSVGTDVSANFRRILRNALTVEGS